MTPIEVCFGGVPLPYAIGGASVGGARRAGRLRRGAPRAGAGCPGPGGRAGARRWPAAASPCPPRTPRTLPSLSHRRMLPGQGGRGLRARRAAAAGRRPAATTPGWPTRWTRSPSDGPGVFYTGKLGAADGRRRCGPTAARSARPTWPRTGCSNVPVATPRWPAHRCSAAHDLNRHRARPARAARRPAPRCPAPSARWRWPTRCGRTRPRQRLGDTTNIPVVDADGNACVITTTLGLGAGVWLPGPGRAPQLDARRGRADTPATWPPATGCPR